MKLDQYEIGLKGRINCIRESRKEAVKCLLRLT